MNNNRYKQLILSALILFVGLLGCQENKQFELLTGQAKSLTDYKGQWVIVNFWAEWCPPCIKEIPDLNQIAEQNDDISVLAVSYDKLPNSELNALVDKYQIRYSVIASDPMPYLPMEKPASLPANYIVTPEGDIVGPIMGKQSKQSLLKLIETLKKTQVLL